MPITNSFDFPELQAADTTDPILIKLYDGNGPSKTPIDLAGAKVFFDVKEKAGDEHYVLRRSTESAPPTIDIANVNEVTIPPFILDTKGGKFIYCLRVVFAGGSQTTFLEGKFPVKPKI